MKVRGALLGTMSGSMGGATASRNRGGQYFRQRVVPTNPSSDRQTAVRSQMAAANAAWISTLTAAQREAWKTYGQNTPRMDTLGNEIILTGQQAYVGARIPRGQAGITTPADGPIIFDRGEPPVEFQDLTSTQTNLIEINLGVLENQVALGDAASDGGFLLVFVGQPQNPTINYFRGPYQFAAQAAFSATDTEVALPTDPAGYAMETPFANAQIRPCRFVLAYDDGRTSTALELMLEVAVA